MPEAARPDRARPTLLDPGFVRELEALRRRLTIRARSGATGEHVARRRGGSAEFLEHRPYAPGDDLRRVDWAAYARSDEPVVKVFHAEEDAVVRLVCDASASLRFGEPPKSAVLARLAAAIGYMTLAGSERAQVLVAHDGSASGGAPARGRGGLPALLRALDAIALDGRTNLAQSVDAACRRSARPGMLVVLSDFLDDGPLSGALDRAIMAGHDVALVHVVAPDEIAPPLEGDWTLEDAETGATIDVAVDAAAVDAYVRRFDALCDALRGWARRRGAVYVRARTDEPLEPPLRRFVARTVD